LPGDQVCRADTVRPYGVEASGHKHPNVATMLDSPGEILIMISRGCDFNGRGEMGFILEGKRSGRFGLFKINSERIHGLRMFIK